MHGKDIEIRALDGSGSFSAYLALPPGGRGPGVVIAQEIFGINEFVRATADRLAQAGYVAIAPDLFWRQEPGVQLNTYSEAEWERAFGFFKGFDMAKGVEDLDAARQALLAHPALEGDVGCVGFCLGGRLAWEAACALPLQVSVGFYGVGIEQALEKAAGITGRVLLHVAEQDGYCPPEAQEKILSALRDDPRVDVQVYPGVDHAFARPASPHFHEASAALAWNRTLAALDGALRGPAS